MTQIIKSMLHLALGVMTIYFLGGLIPKIIDLLDVGYERTFCIIFYWIAILGIIALPQYWIWFTDEDIDLISVIKSLACFATSTLAVVGVTKAVQSIMGSITLSDTTGMIYSICFWLFAILIMYVPQVFVYEPLRERYT